MILNRRFWLVSILPAAVSLFLPQLAAGAETRAVWVWGSTVRTYGAETVASALQARGITDAILLVKGTAGTVAYPSAIAPAAAADDTLGHLLTACHARGIKVHAWLNYHQDDYFAVTKNKYKYTIYHNPSSTKPAPYAINDGRICPLRAKEEYNAYFLSIVDEILRNYAVDGIHLDYIRYPGAYYCFCPAHIQAATEQGIDMNHVEDLLMKTYYVPKDNESYFNAYAAGDPDVAKWVALRVAEIDAMVKAVKDDVADFNKKNKTSVAVSAALMPEGALTSTMATSGARTDQFGLAHYAQNYGDMASMLSFLAPMAYQKDYGQPASWVGAVMAGAVAQAGDTPVLAGLQVYSVTAQEIADSLFYARWGGASGFSLFRWGYSTSAEANWGTIVPTLDRVTASTQTAIDNGWIDNPGIANSLVTKLANVKTSVDQSKTVTAQKQLAAYVNEVSAQSGKHIEAGSARILAGDAQWVLDLMM